MNICSRFGSGNYSNDRSGKNEMAMVRAVIYCRCSTEEESQQNALMKQVEESRNSIRQQGWVLVDEYIEARSGTTTSGRGEYNRLFEDLKMDKFDIIQIKSQDRLMRNVRDWYLFLDRLVTNGKRLYMYLERKFYTPDDALITGIKAILAEEYSKELSKKINNAHKNRQQAGRSFILPASTYGLKKGEDGSYLLIDEEVDIIKTMFYLCEFMGCTSISHYLAEHNMRNRKGEPFSEAVIRQIIRNPIRYGTIVQNKRHFDFLLKKTINVPEEQWIIHENVVPAAVSKTEWLRANEFMNQRAYKGNRNGRYPSGSNPGKYQLSGKIRCGICDGKYYRTYRKSYKGRQIVEWKCQKYLQYGRNDPEKKADAIRKVKYSARLGCDNVHLEEIRFFQLLENFFSRQHGDSEQDDTALIEKALSILNKVLKQNNPVRETNDIERELSKYERQDQKLLDKLLNEVISDEDYKIKKKEIEERKKILMEKRNQLQDAKNALSAMDERLKMIKERLETDTIKKAAMEERIDSIDSITVYPSKIEVSFRENKILGFDQTAVKSTNKISSNIEEMLICEIPLDENFLFSTRKEAENKRILSYMQEDPTITAREIAEMEAISLSAVNARIRRLKRQGRVYFDGRGGHGKWIVVDDHGQDNS